MKNRVAQKIYELIIFMFLLQVRRDQISERGWQKGGKSKVSDGIIEK